MTAQKEGEALAQAGKTRIHALISDAEVIAIRLSEIKKGLTRDASILKSLGEKLHVFSEEEIKEANLPSEGIGPAGPSGPGL